MDGHHIAVVLAAGMGTRMKSDMPKMLHPVCGKPMLSHVIDALEAADIRHIITVLGHGADQVAAMLGRRSKLAIQERQLGTGHALMQTLPELEAYTEGTCLVVCGDTPLISGETLRQLRQVHQQTGAAVTLLTAYMEQPFGYGRIVRRNHLPDQPIMGIVEEKDADETVKRVKEINTGTYCFDLRYLKEGLASLKPANAQGEYYLTDVVGFLTGKGLKAEAMAVVDPAEAMGINDRCQLALAEAWLRKRILRALMLSGVTIRDPETTYIDAGVVIGSDTVVEPGVIISGNSVIGRHCRIGPWVHMTDSALGDHTVMSRTTMLESSAGQSCIIGPFSYIRPHTVLSGHVKIGDFVELKNTKVAPNAKIPHLSYVGDSTVGERVNIGAGTITCNYDGKRKYPTVFEDDCFIGSNSNLVAPVSIGKGAYVGAGSTITKDVPPQALAIAREKQRNIDDWNKSGKD
jgi:bifunctional UDP-N-acetylglucosamine pyrophosphorylase/glucosamine-1-phosphate N-acetyltransferase